MVNARRTTISFGACALDQMFCARTYAARNDEIRFFFYIFVCECNHFHICFSKTLSAALNDAEKWPNALGKSSENSLSGKHFGERLLSTLRESICVWFAAHTPHKSSSRLHTTEGGGGDDDFNSIEIQSIHSMANNGRIQCISPKTEIKFGEHRNDLIPLKVNVR